MADYYNLLEAAQKAPRATARACKSSLKLGQVAAAEIADGPASVDSSWKESRPILRAFAQKDEILIMNSTEDKVFLEATVFSAGVHNSWKLGRRTLYHGSTKYILKKDQIAW